MREHERPAKRCIKQEKDWQGTRAQFDKALARFPWLSPAAHQVFGAGCDPPLLGCSWIPALKQMPVSD